MLRSRVARATARHVLQQSRPSMGSPNQMLSATHLSMTILPQQVSINTSSTTFLTTSREYSNISRPIVALSSQKTESTRQPQFQSSSSKSPMTSSLSPLALSAITTIQSASFSARQRSRKSATPHNQLQTQDQQTQPMNQEVPPQAPNYQQPQQQQGIDWNRWLGFDRWDNPFSNPAQQQQYQQYLQQQQQQQHPQQPMTPQQLQQYQQQMHQQQQYPPQPYTPQQQQPPYPQPYYNPYDPYNQQQVPQPPRSFFGWLLLFIREWFFIFFMFFGVLLAFRLIFGI